MATILQRATVLVQDSCALGKQLRKKLTSRTGHSPAPVLVLHSFHGLHAGKQKGRIHLVVLHAVPLNNFSPLTLDISQSQSSESQFIQIPKGFRVESFHTSLTQQIQPGSYPKLKEVYFLISLQEDSAVTKLYWALSFWQQNLSPAFGMEVSILQLEEQHH